MTAELPLERYEKYAGEKSLLGFNFRRFAGNGVIITTPNPTYTVEVQGTPGASGDITVSGASFDGLRVQAYFAGGVAGATYLVKVKANLSDGQAPREIHILLYILSL